MTDHHFTIQQVEALKYIRFEAISKEKNIFRYYEIHMTKDLFGAFCLQTFYGRIGTRGRCYTYPFLSLESLEKQLNRIIQKRLFSFRRIGTCYKITHISCRNS